MLDRIRRRIRDREPRHWTLFASLGFCAVLAACIGVVLWPRSDDPPAVPSAPPAELASDDPGAPSGFITPVDPSAVIPADVSWQLSGPIAVPSAPSTGPLVTGPAGVRSGFSRTPGGAVFAAVNFAAQVNDPSQDRQALISQRLEHSTGYDYLAQAFLAYDSGGERMEDAPAVWQVAAVRLVAYSPDTAYVVVVMRSHPSSTNQQPGISASPLTASGYLLAWSLGDWRIVPAADGGGNQSQTLTDLPREGYVRLSGVG